MNYLINLPKRSITQKMVFCAILSVIAYVLNLIEIPYFVPFLRLDISDVVVLFALLTIGLPYAFAVIVIKTFLFAASGGNGSEIIGISLMFVSSSIIALLFYTFHKIFKLNIYLSLVITTLLFSIILTLINYYITFPLYNATSFEQLNKPGYFLSIFTLFFPFNLIKLTIDSIILIILKKSLLTKRKHA